jgi:hypothetical protein
MKYIVLISALVALGCNGKLTDEQKRKIKEERADSQLKKISEAEITEAAFSFGRSLAQMIEKGDKTLLNKSVIDSLEATYSVEIVEMKTSDSTLRAIEKRVIEAYVAGGDAATLNDNIQKTTGDSILYTKPLMIQQADGSMLFSKALGIRMSKKQVILAIK